MSLRVGDFQRQCTLGRVCLKTGKEGYNKHISGSGATAGQRTRRNISCKAARTSDSQQQNEEQEGLLLMV